MSFNNEIRNYDPLYDFLFMGYMASSGCERQLTSLINAILVENDENLVSELEIVDNKSLPANIMGKKSCILDLRSVALDGRIINIEVQRQNEKFFKRRNQLYISREFSNSADEGKFRFLKEHIQINILGFKFCENEKISRKFNIIDKTDTKCEYSQCIKIINISLVPFRKIKKIDFNNHLHRWLVFLDKNSTIEMVEMVMSKDEAIKLAHEKVKELLKDEKFLHKMNIESQRELKYESEMAYAEDKGIKKGKKKGIEQGELNIAKKLIEAGMSIEEIAKTTGLSIAKLEKL